MAKTETVKAELTTTGIRALDPTTGETIWDSELQGFGLRTRRSVDPRRWAWTFRYRKPGGRDGGTVRLSEPFSRLTPEEARQWAKRERSRKGTAQGKHEQAQENKRLRQEARQRAEEERRLQEAEQARPTVQRLWEEYWRAEGRLKKASTRKVNERLWRDHLSPTFASRKVGDVEPSDVESFKEGLSDRPIACNRSLALLSRMFTLAVRSRYRAACAPEHPVKGVARYPERPVEFYFTADELGRILRAADAEANTGGGLAVRMLALTGARLSEVIGAHWGQFDFLPGECGEEGGGGAWWTVESSNTKNARPVTRFIDPDLSRLLLAWRPLSLGMRDTVKVVELGCPLWVFPKQPDPGQPMRQLRNVWERIREAAGVRKGRVHDLRHTVATHMRKAGRPMSDVTAQLGHATWLTTQRYAHIMPEAVVATGSFLGRLGASVEAAARKPEVVSLADRRAG